MSNKPTFSRSDFVRTGNKKRDGNPKRSGPSTSHRRTYNQRSVLLPVDPRLKGSLRSSGSARQANQGRRTQRYEKSSANRSYAFQLGQTELRAPVIALPQFDLSNPRWLSGLISLALLALTLWMWNSSSFVIEQAEVMGNQRIASEEVISGLGILGEPVFKAVPSDLVGNVRTTFTELSDVKVKVTFPNRVLVTVEERTPTLVWCIGDSCTWIDSNGIAFQPRGEVPGLVQVLAQGNPPEILVDPNQPEYEKPFITPAMVNTIVSLAPSVPQGLAIIYDPTYGIGWQDPRGWNVYFGLNAQDVNMKITIYNTLVDRLTQQGIQPTLISMAYLDAPFYK